MSNDAPGGAPRFGARWWWDHSGRISGAVLGLFFLAFLALLAASGDRAVGIVLVLLVAGAAMIVVGGRIHGRR